MTSVSLLRQRHTTGNPTATAREMLRLNFVWAVGACACPTLALQTLHTGDLALILAPLAAFFFTLALWSTFLLPSPASLSTPAGFRHLFRLVPARLILMTALIIGVEASAGGWLSTYAHRGGLHLGATIEAPTCLWAGLLLSRLLWSFSTQPGARILRGSIALITSSALLLITPAISTHGGILLLLGSFALGFGIGPTYPLLLAAVARFHQGSAIFFLAGIGAATLPWLTGLVSGRNASLRAGFTVPLAATFVLLLLSALPLPSASAESHKLVTAGCSLR